MPEAAVAPPPPAAPAAPPPVKPSTAPPINVTPAAVDKGPAQPPPKPGSARDQMFRDLRQKAGAEEPPAPPAAKTDTSPHDETKETPPTGEAPPPAADKGKGKTSPWKLVDEHKSARLKAETELAELRKSMVPPEKVQEYEAKLTKLEKDFQAAQEELRFTNYAKSQEFAEKYQKPYEDAWKRWMGELGELTLSDPASPNGERPIQPQDLLELVNLPLGKARERAETLFGNFADDAMSARKEIRSLFDAQNNALEEARKQGTERDAARVKQLQEAQQKLASQVNEIWTKANESAQADERVGKYLKPVEGDEEYNTRLKKGFEIADQGFRVNSLDPRLTPEQRQQAVQLHSAIRNRAAAFGSLVYRLEKSDAKIAQLEAELNKYKSAQPGAGEPRKEGGTPAAGTARDQVFGALRKIAH